MLLNLSNISACFLTTNVQLDYENQRSMKNVCSEHIISRLGSVNWPLRSCDITFLLVSTLLTSSYHPYIDQIIIKQPKRQNALHFDLVWFKEIGCGTIACLMN